MTVVEEPGVILAGGAVRVGAANVGVIADQEGGQIVLVNQGVIRRDAGLAAIDQFADDDPGACVIGRVALLDDPWFGSQAARLVAMRCAVKQIVSIITVLATAASAAKASIIRAKIPLSLPRFQRL